MEPKYKMGLLTLKKKWSRAKVFACFCVFHHTRV